MKVLHDGQKEENMPGPDFSNLKAIANDLVSRQAKFGSYKASVDALKKKYVHDDYDNGVNISFVSKDGTYIGNAIYNKDFGSVLNDMTVNGNSGVTYQTLPCKDKFVKLNGYDSNANCTWTISDSNNNGYIDEDDKIEIYQNFIPEGTPLIVQTLAKFLGL